MTWKGFLVKEIPSKATFMNNFLVRTASAVVFVSLLLGALFFHFTAFAVVMGFFSIVALWEYAQMAEKLEMNFSKLAYVLGGGILFFAIYFSRFTHPASVGLVSVALVIIHIGYEVWSEKGNVKRLVYALFGYLYAIVPFGLTSYIVLDANQAYHPEWMLLLFAIIWCNDTFAYLVGMSIGKHKMCPRVSPKKSWEGFAGGMVSALIIAILISKVHPMMSLEKAIFLCVFVAVAGVLGDLVESLFKRTAQVKDSGTMIPGHGGVLDRFDAVMLAIPIMYIFLMM